MMSKMIKCKTCGADIASSAKTCPGCGAKNKKPFYKKWWVWFIVVIVLIGAAGSGATAGSGANTNNNSSIETASSNKVDTKKETKETEDKSNSITVKRENLVGTSNKNIDDLNNAIIFSDTVRNDVTGKWRLCRLADNIQMEEYALSYYKKYFKNDDEVHVIINFTLKTTTVIKYNGLALDIRIYDYIDKEEHDAKLMATGTFLSEYWVYIDNGDIEKIQ